MHRSIWDASRARHAARAARLAALAIALLGSVPWGATWAQGTGGWQTSPAATQPAAPAPPATPPPGGFGNTTVLPRAAPEPKPVAPQSPSATQAPGAPAQPAAAAPAGGPLVKLVALLTADGQRIDQGLVWRVFQEAPGKDAKPKLLATVREASPMLKIPPGDYKVVVSFGRAHLTRKITVPPAAQTTEQFVLNAGGLRVAALAGTQPAPSTAVTYDILAGERDQQDNRALVMSGAKPGLIIRLNAGIYHIVSTYGDANATVRADVTVEAGKLTEATVVHNAGKVTFKLVTRTGGEALPGAQWQVQAADGSLVKESMGALPTHILAPGAYSVTARSAGKAFRRDFSVKPGEMTEVEVLMQ